MADEQTKPPYKKPLIIPGDYAWPSFQNRDGGNLENHYRETLVELGKSGGMLGSSSARRRTVSRTRPSLNA